MRPRNRKPPFAVIDAPPVEPPSPPRKLGPTGQDLWARVQAEYVIIDIGGVELLQQCCEAADLVQELAECVARDGKMIPTASGQRANPLLRDMLSARAFVCTTLRRLGVTNEPVGRIGRPSGPQWRGNVD
jgi:Phage terminase, small subunit